MHGGHQEIALTNYDKAVELAPSQAQVYSARAAYWLEQGESQKAIDDCRKSLEIEATEEGYSILGDAYLALEDLDNAIQAYSQTKRLDPKVAQAYQRRAERRQGAGDAAGAQADRDKAGSIDPSLRQ